jgi:hypothetical protein
MCWLFKLIDRACAREINTKLVEEGYASRLCSVINKPISAFEPKLASFSPYQSPEQNRIYLLSFLKNFEFKYRYLYINSIENKNLYYISH